jgi:xanthine dehydrogenase small subunit
MRDHVVFAVNGREFRAGGREIFNTLANWLRYRACATGTKIVCEEGDCGACSVLVRRSAGEDFKPVNACILTLAQMDGASIVTVEGLGLNGVQQSMIAHHGAQCGYCTPGFVVAMSGMFECCDRVTEAQVRDGLTGNLCRCTGYEPIIKAALAVDRRSMPKLRERYPAIPDARDAVSVENPIPSAARNQPGRDVGPVGGASVDSSLRSELSFFAPVSVAEAVQFKAKNPGCTILQGATDVGVWITKRNFTAPAMLSLFKIDALNTIAEENGHIAVGANVTLSRFEEAIEDRIPELHRILHVFGSPQIRNAGTLIGNIANGSPIGDTLPYLFVADAQLELAGTRGTRLVPINTFYLGYKKFDLQPDEIITRVFVPVVKDTLKLYKVSRRRDLDISAFTAAIRLKVNGHIEEARVAYGGVAPTVVRLPKTESFLTGKAPSLDVFERAGEIARSEVKPISDVRGSAAFRSQLAENIMSKFFYEAFA